MDAGEWDERYRSADRLWSVTPNLYVADRLGGAHTGARAGPRLPAKGGTRLWLAGVGLVDDRCRLLRVATSSEGADQGSDAVEFIVADVRDWDTEHRFDLVLIAYLHSMPGDFEKVVRRSPGLADPGRRAVS